jgi:hypothetical protein
MLCVDDQFKRTIFSISLNVAGLVARVSLQ